MKKIIAIICLAALVISAQAQTNVQTFFTSAETFLTDFDTNYSWTNISFEASTGLKQVTGAGATDVVNAQGDNLFGTGLELGPVLGLKAWALPSERLKPSSVTLYSGTMTPKWPSTWSVAIRGISRPMSWSRSW